MIFSKSASPHLRRSRKSLIALSGLLLAIAVPGTLVYGKQISDFPTVLSSAILGQQAPVYKFNVGQRLVYRLDYQNSANSDLRVLFSDIKDAGKANSTTAPSSFLSAFENQVQADLVMTIVAQRPEGFLVSYRLQNPNVTIKSNGQLIKEQSQLIQTDLDQEIFATIDAQGKILSLRFDPKVSTIAQSFARTLLASIQFVTPQTLNRPTWETQEANPNGEYIAKYEAKLDKFQKTKLRYLQPATNKPSNKAKLIPIITSSGQLSAAFDRQLGHLKSLSGKESQTFEVSKKKVGQAETNLNLVYVSQTQLSDPELATLRAVSAKREQQAPAVGLSQPVSEQQSDEKIQRQQLGDSTLEGLLAELDQAEKTADRSQDYTSLYLKFKALVYLQPETSQALADRLMNVTADSLSMQMLVGALSASSHEKAQAALVQVLQNRTQDLQSQLLIIPSLASSSAPSPATVSALQQLGFNATDHRVISTAQLALGTIANTLAEKSPDRANAIVDQFIQRLSNAKSEDETKQNLLVLGNAGSSRSLNAMTKFLTSPQSEIRAIALVSLRGIQDPQVDRLLNQALSQDTDETVRAETAVALSFREMNPTNFASQKQALLNDPSAKVRLTVLKNLWQVREQFLEIDSIVEKLVQTDASQDVREAAKELVAEKNSSFTKTQS
jgi:hypothetical protein